MSVLTEQDKIIIRLSQHIIMLENMIRELAAKVEDKPQINVNFIEEELPAQQTDR